MRDRGPPEEPIPVGSRARESVGRRSIFEDLSADHLPTKAAGTSNGDHSVTVRIRRCDRRGTGANPVGPPNFL